MWAAWTGSKGAKPHGAPVACCWQPSAGVENMDPGMRTWTERGATLCPHRVSMYGEPTLLYPNFQGRGSEQEPCLPQVLTHMVTMTTMAKRQGPIVFQAALRSSCKDMAKIRVPRIKRTWAKQRDDGGVMGALGQAVFDGTRSSRSRRCGPAGHPHVPSSSPALLPAPLQKLAACVLLCWWGGGTPLPAPTLLGPTGPSGPSTGVFLMQFLLLLLFLAMLHDLWDLSFLTMGQTWALALKALRPNHWTARKFPVHLPF